MSLTAGPIRGTTPVTEACLLTEYGQHVALDGGSTEILLLTEYNRGST
jgi:hypothetical protein